MREPPDQRKGPRRLATRQGPNRKHHHQKITHTGSSKQQAAYFRGLRRQSESIHAVAKRLRDDGLAPIRVRTFAAQSAHCLAIGGWVSAEDERQLRRLNIERRRQLAALRRLYG